jgi:uncharacterized protein YeaO (DUF488 family)
VVETYIVGRQSGTGEAAIRLAVKTKSIYEPKEEGDGVRVLITRYYPRGVKKDRFDRWMRDLSPSRDLLRAYRSKEKSWDELVAEFRAELDANPAGQAALAELRRDSRKGAVTLLCYERTGNPCHRKVVAELIE